jgi:hypothetical protein
MPYFFKTRNKFDILSTNLVKRQLLKNQNGTEEEGFEPSLMNLEFIILPLKYTSD